MASTGCTAKIKATNSTRRSETKGTENRSVIPESVAVRFIGHATLVIPAGAGLVSTSIELSNAAIEAYAMDDAVTSLGTTKTSDRDGGFALVTGRLTDARNLTVVLRATQLETGATGRAIVPLGSLLSALGADTLQAAVVDVSTDISTESSVLTSIAIEKNVALEELTAAKVAALLDIIRGQLPELMRKNPDMKPDQLATALLEMKGVRNDIQFILETPGKLADRDPEKAAAWNSATATDLGKVLGTEFSDLIVTKSTLDGEPPVLASDKLVDPTRISFTVDDVPESYTAVAFSISPRPALPAGEISCVTDDLFRAGCPTPIVVNVDSTQAASVAFDPKDLVPGQVYTVHVGLLVGAAKTEAAFKEYRFVWSGGSARPKADFTIDGAADGAVLSRRALTLRLTSPAEARTYVIGASADCADAGAPMPFAGGPLAVLLPEGDGAKIICVKVFDDKGQASEPKSLRVVLDTAAPSIQMTPVPAQLGPQRVSGPEILLSGSAVDANGLATAVAVLRDNDTGECLTAARTAFTVACASGFSADAAGDWSISVPTSLLQSGHHYAVSVAAADRAGNEATGVGAAAFGWDATPPDATFTTPAFVNVAALPLTLTSPTQVLSRYRVAAAASCAGAAWQTYSGTLSASLPTTDGAHPVCLEIEDEVGNAATFSASTTLDTQAPNARVATTGVFGPATVTGTDFSVVGTATDATTTVTLAKVSLRDGSASCLNEAKTAFNAACPNWISAVGTGSWSLTFAKALLQSGHTYNVSVRATDQAANESPTAAGAFSWDAAVPAAAFAVNAGNPLFTTAAAVSLVLTDDSSVASYRVSQAASCASAVWSAWQAYAGGGAIPFTLGGSDGLKLVCLETQASGGSTASASDSITLDRIGPEAALSLPSTLSPDSTVGSMTLISGTASDATSGVATVQVSIALAGSCLNSAGTAFDAACPLWRAAGGTTSWTTTLSDSILTDGASYQVSARATDNGGLVQGVPATASFTWDATAPDATFTLTHGASIAYATTTAITLALADDSGVVEAAVMNGSDCTAAVFAAYSPLLAHALAAGDGLKTVCLKVKDAVGNVSTTATDTITLDTTRPTSTSSIAAVLGPASTAGANTTLTGTAADANGVTGVEVSIASDTSGQCLNAGATAFDAACPAWRAASGTTAWSLSVADSLFTSGLAYTASIRATDSASLVQTSLTTDTFVWDAVAPSPTYNLNGSASYATATAATLDLTDATGVAEVAIADGTDCSAATFAAYGAPVSYTLPAPDGVKTVCLKVRDAVGNISGTATDTIILDTTKPTSTSSIAAVLGPASTAGANTTLAGTAADANGITGVAVSVASDTSGQCLNAGATAFDAACPVWHTASGTTAWSLSVADALFTSGQSYTASIRATDSAGLTQTSLTTDTFAWNGDAPNPAFDLNGGAAYATATGVTLDLVDATVVAEVALADGTDCSGASFIAYGAPLSHTIPASDGTKTVCLKVKDAIGNISATATATIVLDTTKPTSTSSIAAVLSPPSTAGANTTLSGTAADANGVIGVEVSLASDASGQCLNAGATAFDAACPVWRAASGTTAWSLTVADSLFTSGQSFTASIRATDAAGLVQTSLTMDTFAWDADAPSATFALNGSAAYATTTAVALDLVDATGVAEVAIADGPDCSSAGFAAYGAPISHTLPSSDGTKTVCLKVRDAVGNISGTATDTIILDTTKPTSTSAIATVLSPVSTAGANTVLAGTAADANGVTGVEVSIASDTSGQCLNSGATAFDAPCPVWRAASGTTSWSLTVADSLFASGQSYTASIRATDSAGLVQTSLTTDSFSWDAAAPSATFTLNAGAAYATATGVTLDLADPTDVAGVAIADGADCSSATFAAYGAPVSHTLPGPDGAKTVCLLVKDAVGNVSTTATATIALDTTKPTSTSAIATVLAPASTAGATTALTGTAADANGVTGVEVSLASDASGQCLNSGGTAFNAACPVWRTASGTTSWSLTVADSAFTSGQNFTASIRATDTAGLVQTSLTTDTFAWDADAPNQAFTINSAATYTVSTGVSIAYTDTTGIASYRLAEGADCSGAAWQTYSGAPSFTLSGADGTKTLCSQVKDALENVSAASTQTITLDATRPASAIATSGTIGPLTTAGATTAITGTASDNDALGAVAVSIAHASSGNCLNAGKTAFDASCPEWIAATGTATWSLTVNDSVLTDGIVYNVSSRATDAAGNVQTSLGTASFTWDSASPGAFSATAPTGTVATSTPTATWGAATGASTYDLKIATASDCLTSVQTFSGLSGVSQTLSSLANGTYYVCVTAYDAAGNATAATNQGSLSFVVDVYSLSCDSGTLATTCIISTTHSVPPGTSVSVPGNLTVQSGGKIDSSTTTIFSGDFATSGAISQGITTYGSTWAQSGGVLAQNSTAAGDPKKAVIHADGDYNPTEVLTRLRVDAWTDGTYARAGVGLRVSNQSSTGGYYMVFNYASATKNNVSFLNDGVAWGNTYSFAWTVGTWYWFRLKIVSGVLYGRVWEDGTSEPGTWPYSQSGWTGITTGSAALHGGSSGSGSSRVSFDDVTVINGTAVQGTMALNVGGNLDVQSGGSLEADFSQLSATNVTVGGTVKSNISALNATNVTVSSGGSMHANGRGAGGGPTGKNGYGTAPGLVTVGGYNDCGGGGGHGGVGGRGIRTDCSGGTTYGSAASPVTYGSGGAGNGYGLGGAGGGGIKITATGTVTVNGTLAAKGDNAPASHGGGGAGGSLWVTAANLAGTGTMSVAGGNGNGNGGGGGGGRMSLTSANKFLGTLSVAAGAAGSGSAVGGDDGSYYQSITNVCDTGTLATTCTISAPTPLTDGTTLSGAGSLVIASGGNLYSMKTTDSFTINMTGDVTVQSGGAINGNVSGLTAANVTIASGGSVTAAAKGFNGGRLNVSGSGTAPGLVTPGGYNDCGGGGGHGGAGGRGIRTDCSGGTTYGSAASPVTYGSGGGGNGYGLGGAGGGAIKITTAGILTVNGTLSAAGENAPPSHGGGGAGGSLWLAAGSMAGTGTISVAGGNGNGNGGGGGGGRLSLTSANKFVGTTSIAGGAAGSTQDFAGGAGSFYQVVTNLCDSGSVADTCTISTVTPLGTGVGFSGAGSLVVASGGSIYTANVAETFAITMTGDVTVQSGGSIIGNLTDLTAANVTIASGASVTAAAKGFAGGLINLSGTGTAPGLVTPGGYNDCGGGGGHGGAGGRGLRTDCSGGTTYGSLASPVTFGSGGGGNGYGLGGAGGGAIKVTTTGVLTVSGTLSASGQNAPASHGGGGAGGSLWLTVGSMAGTGTISVAGGNGNGNGGGGGGGRLSLTSANKFAGTMSIAGGAAGSGQDIAGGDGSYYQAVTNLCDSGSVAGTCTISVATPLGNGVSLSGAGSLVVASGGSLLAANSADTIAITMTGDVTVQSGGSIVGNVSGISGANVTIASGASVTAAGRGFAGGRLGANGLGTGPGIMTPSGYGDCGGGGGHGGAGGRGIRTDCSGGAAYGSIASPVTYGSGGGGNGYGLGGAGGGAIKITASGVLTVSGTLSAAGENAPASYGGGGAGGSVWLTAASIAGSGTISVAGGNGNGNGGGGGGGRFSLTSANKFAGTMSIAGGAAGSAQNYAGGDGTFYQAVTSLCDSGSMATTCTISVPTALGASQTLTGTGSLVLAAAGTLYPASSADSIAVRIGGDLTVETGASIVGNVAYIAGRNITIQSGSTVTAAGRGYAGGRLNLNGLGPAPGIMTPGGYADCGGGGGHGGAGGSGTRADCTGGTATGSAVYPSAMGSGGGATGYGIGGAGGGVIKLIASGTLTVSGTISVTGDAAPANHGGGGAGGSVWLDATTLAGNGTITASGGSGNNNGGGGGGGRISTYYESSSFSGTMAVAGGAAGSVTAVAGSTGSVSTQVLNTNYHKIFLTAATYDGLSVASLANADATCASEASAGGYGGSMNWVAVLSGPGSAAGRLTIAGPVINALGTVAMTGSAQMWGGGAISAPVAYDFLREDAGAVSVWTGSSTAGTASSTCSSWTSASNGLYGTVGLASSMTSGWVNQPDQTCDNAYRLYCVSQP